MSEPMDFTDRYKAIGIPYPDPETMCQGPCEGVGIYPENDPASALWREAHTKPHEELCNGWHFVSDDDLQAKYIALGNACLAGGGDGYALRGVDATMTAYFTCGHS